MFLCLFFIYVLAKVYKSILFYVIIACILDICCVLYALNYILWFSSAFGRGAESGCTFV